MKVFLNVATFFLMVASPVLILAIGSAVAGGAGSIVATVLESLYSLLSGRSKKHPIQQVDYRLKRIERRPVGARKGKMLFPWDNKEYKRHFEGNVGYPMPGTRRYKEAQKLNVSYFAGSSYPFSYIVMGDRAMIEEARKGGRLSREEEHWIGLGYGYDGKPFGTPWGIEQECFEGYRYAEENGDFYNWAKDSEKYKQIVAHLGDASPAMSELQNDMVLSSERILTNIGNEQNVRLSQSVLYDYQQGRKAIPRKLASVQRGEVVSI